MSGGRMGWGPVPYTAPVPGPVPLNPGLEIALEPDRFHEIPEQVIIGQGPARSWLWVAGIGAAVAALVFIGGKGD